MGFYNFKEAKHFELIQTKSILFVVKVFLSTPFASSKHPIAIKAKKIMTVSH